MSRAFNGLLCLLVALGFVPAQLPQDLVQPVGTVSAPFDLLIDEPGDGRVWARGRTYKAGFGPCETTYVPFLGGDAPRSWPLTLRLQRVSIGGRPLPGVSDGVVRNHQRQVVIDRGAVREMYVLEPGRMEQFFVFDRLPGADDLNVALHVETDLEFTEDRDGFLFSCDRGAVRYGRAFAVDAAGRRLALESRFENGCIHLRVPRAFVAEATFPLTIDPLISTVTFASLPIGFPQPDVAYDATTDRFAVTYVDAFSAVDFDVYALLREGSPSGTTVMTIPIDMTTEYWDGVKVANLNDGDRFLVVASRGDGFTPREIWGREVLASSGITSAQFSVAADPGGDMTDPDVGGDPTEPAQPGTASWCVVWTQNDLLGNTAIMSKVLSSLTTVPAQATVIDPFGTGAPGTNLKDMPRLSNGCGTGPDRRWGLVWRRHPDAAFPENDITAAQINPDGTVAVPPYTVKPVSSLVSLWSPSISSLTDPIAGTRRFLVAYDEQPFPPTTSITRAHVHLLENGVNTVGLGVDLSVLGGAAATARQLAPSVDSEGCRFAVVFMESPTGGGGGPGGAPPQLNVWSSTLGIDALGALELVEGPLQIDGAAPGLHVEPRVVSTYSAGGARVRCLAIWSGFQFPIPTTDDIYAAFLDAMPAAALTSTNTSACAGLTISRSGYTTLGNTITYSLDNAVGPYVIAFGIPLSNPFPICGASCELWIDVFNPQLPLFDSFDAPLTFTIPCEPLLSGLPIVGQGAEGIGSACNGGFRMSNAIIDVIH